MPLVSGHKTVSPTFVGFCFDALFLFANCAVFPLPAPPPPSSAPCSRAGQQVKVKCRPLDVAFGGKQDQDECIVSVNMDGRTILLYNLHDQENALELAFQVCLIV